MDHHGLAVGSDGAGHGQLIYVGFEVLFLLPAVGVEALPEVSLPVEKADSDKWDIEVGSALDVVARQDAEAARIDGKRFV